MSQQQFENFTASSLYCEKCKAAMPVRERLLLILPDKESTITFAPAARRRWASAKSRPAKK